MAQADSTFGNNDGDVALAELSNVATSDFTGLRTSEIPNGIDGSVGEFAPVVGVPIPTDLEALVYQVLYPSMFHYGDTGQCQATPGPDESAVF
jgi:hypothetical protein